jgi:hypothetical protein
VAAEALRGTSPHAKHAPSLWGSGMIAIMRLAAFSAALVAMFAGPAAAQEQPAAASQSSDSYKPPARFIGQDAALKGQKSAPPPAVAAGKAAPGMKTVGLISIIGESFTVKKIGIMVFGNEEETFPSAGWKIDDRVASSVSRILKKNFKVKRIGIPVGAYAAFRNGDFFLKSVDDEFAKFVAKYTAGQGCDYYLVVSPGGSQVGSTNQSISGLGVLRSSSAFNSYEHVHALSSIGVYDSQMKPLRSERGTIGQDTFLAGIKGPHIDLAEAERLPPEPKAAFADPRAQRLAWDLLDKSLAMTVPKLLAAE